MDSLHLLSIIFYVAIALLSILQYEKGDTKIDLTRKVQVKRPPFPKGWRNYMFAITFSIMIWSKFSSSPFLLTVFDSELIAGLGLFISMVGFLVFSIAKKSLGENFSGCEDPYLPRKIVANGIYSFIRHPIYTSNLLMVFGLFLNTGSLWILLVAIAMIKMYSMSAKIEEGELAREFPEYSDYIKRTGRFFPAGGLKFNRYEMN